MHRAKLFDAKSQSRAAWNTRHAQVEAELTSGKQEKVSDTEGSCNLNKILQNVFLPHPQLGGGVWLHHPSHIKHELRARSSQLRTVDDKSSWNAIIGTNASGRILAPFLNFVLAHCEKSRESLNLNTHKNMEESNK
eukprot:m.30487 g.30487  ORF g.30487 m.30487 type:complete len:136 (+) comp9285_c1_seq1:760-1167(+)